MAFFFFSFKGELEKGNWTVQETWADKEVEGLVFLPKSKFLLERERERDSHSARENLFKEFISIMKALNHTSIVPISVLMGKMRRRN